MENLLFQIPIIQSICSNELSNRDLLNLRQLGKRNYEIMPLLINHLNLSREESVKFWESTESSEFNKTWIEKINNLNLAASDIIDVSKLGNIYIY